MMVMPANNTHYLVHYWQGLYGGLGHIISPSRTYAPMPHLPYALDNGAYADWSAKRQWDAEAFLSHVERYAFLALRPSWVVVPDVVGDKHGTLAKWDEWAPRLECFHLPLAFAVQDGMTPNDVPEGADVVFVGGTTAWKWMAVPEFCCSFPRVHVGRVNGKPGLDMCAKWGAESCDGTGWFRGRSAQLVTLGMFLAEQAGKPWEPGTVELTRLKGRGQRCLAV